MIKHIFFDVYQTLLDVDIHQKNIESGWNIFEEYLLKKNVSKLEANKFRELFNEQESQFYKKFDKKLHHHDWVDNIFSILNNYYHLNISMDEAKSLMWLYRQATCEFCKPYPGVKRVLSKLSAKYILSTASLAHGSIAKIELEKAGIAKYFTNLIFTSEIGYRKPSKEFYKALLHKAGAKSSESLMIGDNLSDDIFGANSVGIKTIWIQNPITSTIRAEVIPDQILDIKDFSEIQNKINLCN